MKILYVSPFTPHPAAGGSALHTFYKLKALAKRHQVMVCTYYDQNQNYDTALLEDLGVQTHLVPLFNGAPSSTIAKLTGLLTPIPYTVQSFQSSGLKKQVQTLNVNWQPDVIHCGSLHMAWVPEVIDWQRPSILDQRNVEYTRRQNQTTNPSYLSKKHQLLQAWESLRLKRYERQICLKYTHVTTVTVQDRDSLLELTHNKAIVTHTPPGVDLEQYPPVQNDHCLPRLVFAGTMSYQPNEDAMLYFCSEILPRIVQAVPDVTLTIVGRQPTAKIRALADDPRITVTGTVPDIRPYFVDSSVCVIPVRIGGGIKQKLLAAMAMGMPVVTNNFSKIGIPLKSGVQAIVEDEADAFARAVISLLGDQARRQVLGAAAAQFIRDHFSWKQSITQLEAVYEQALVDHHRK